MSWLTILDSSIPTKSTHSSDGLGRRVRLLGQGIFIGHRLRELLQTSINLHVILEAPISRARVRILAQAAELLQAMFLAYKRRSASLVLELPHLLCFALNRLSSLVAPAREALEISLAAGTSGWGKIQGHFSGRGAGADGARQDAIAAAAMLEKVLSGPPTSQRQELTRLCFDILKDSKCLKDGTFEDASELMDIIEIITDTNWHFENACDTSFLFFSRELLSVS